MTRFAIVDVGTRAPVAYVVARSYRDALAVWVAKHCGTGPVDFAGRVTRKTCVVRSSFDVALFGGPDAVRAERAS